MGPRAGGRGWLERILVRSPGDGSGTSELMVEVDTRHLAPSDVEALLHGMEAVVVDAAFDPAAPTLVT